MSRREFRQEKKNFLHNFILFFIILFLVVLVIGIVREYFKQTEMNKELAGLESELAKLNWDKNKFLQSIDEFESDYFVEREARTKFNLKKEGEKVVVVPLLSLPAENDGVKNDQAEGGEKRGVYWRNASVWWDYFFDARSS